MSCFLLCKYSIVLVGGYQNQSKRYSFLLLLVVTRVHQPFHFTIFVATVPYRGANCIIKILGSPSNNYVIKKLGYSICQLFLLPPAASSRHATILARLCCVVNIFNFMCLLLINKLPSSLKDYEDCYLILRPSMHPLCCMCGVKYHLIFVLVSSSQHFVF